MSNPYRREEDILKDYRFSGYKIIKREEILFKEIVDKCKEYLYILGNGEQFIVYCPSIYVSDNSFTSYLDAFDMISYNIAEDLEIQVDTLRKAQNLYRKILKYSKLDINLADIVGENCKIYATSDSCINYDYRKSRWIKSTNIYEHSLVTNLYQRIIVRLVQVKDIIYINGVTKLRFESVEDASTAFDKLVAELKDYEELKLNYYNTENDITTVLERILPYCLKSDYFEAKVDRDKRGRITKADITFTYGVNYVSLKYGLPTRNGNYHGYTTDSNIYAGGKYHSFSYLGDMVSSLKTVEECLKEDIKISTMVL